jgi:TRAP-type C4-dicarboxylate transport system permease small subunit
VPIRSWPAVAYRAVETLVLWLAYAALFLMMALTTADALLRYFLNAPLHGVLELTEEFFMPMIVYFSMAYVYADNGHVRITLLADRFPAWLQRTLQALFGLVTAALFAVIGWGIGTRALASWAANEYSTSPLNYVIAPSFAIVAIGSALMIVRALQGAVVRLPERRETVVSLD